MPNNEILLSPLQPVSIREPALDFRSSSIPGVEMVRNCRFEHITIYIAYENYKGFCNCFV